MTSYYIAGMGVRHSMSSCTRAEECERDWRIRTPGRCPGACAHRLEPLNVDRTKERIDPSEEEIHDLLRDRGDLEETFRSIVRKHAVSLAEVFGSSRAKHITRARMDCFVALAKLDWSPSAIGRLFGRDHSMVAGTLKRWREGS